MCVYIYIYYCHCYTVDDQIVFDGQNQAVITARETVRPSSLMFWETFHRNPPDNHMKGT